MSNEALKIDERDNVATALRDLVKGQNVSITGGRAGLLVTTAEGIRAGHKLALQEIKKGEDVIKYGETIGKATADIAPGSHVHVHNVEGRRGRGDLQ